MLPIKLETVRGIENSAIWLISCIVIKLARLQNVALL